MTTPSIKSGLIWAIVPVAVIALVLSFNRAAEERIASVSGLLADSLVLERDEASPTGLAGSRHQQIVPGHNLASFATIAEAEALLHADDWQLRQMDYDNAPQGREVRSPSAARWWLATVATLHPEVEENHEPVAHAALHADPLLHLILIVSLAALIGWRFGWFAAAMAAVIVGMSYPLLGIFHPGAPTEKGLTTLLASGALLGWMTGWHRTLAEKPSLLPALVSGAAAGGIWWISLYHGVALTLILAATGFVSVWLTRRMLDRTPGFAWLAWSAAGAITVVGLWAVDYAGTELAWGDERWREIHPFHATSWLGIGWALFLIQRGTWNRMDWLQLGGAVALILTVPIMMLRAGQLVYPPAGLGADLMTHFPDSATADSLGAWVNQLASKSATAGVLLPLGLIGVAAWQVVNGGLEPSRRVLLLAAMVPVLVGALLGFGSLSWWSIVFVALAVLTALLATTFDNPKSQLGLAGGVLFAVGVGWADLAPRMGESSNPQLTDADRQSLAERHLAHWLSLRRDEFRSVVLSPPEVTPSLHYYGGVRGLGSPYPENGDGFIAAVRIASATSPDESLALATQRELSHVVIPSWDDFLDEYAELGAAQPEHSLMAMLHQWLAPRWLRPMQIHFPEADEIEGKSVTVFAVSETQDNASALARLGEYFAETGRSQFAAAIAVTLRDSFPSDLSGLVAQAQIAISQGNVAVFEETMEAIVPFVEDARDGDLEFDRRVSLANVLMLGREIEFAEEQVQYCMDEVDDYLLLTVSPPNLNRFMLLAQSFEEPFPEPELETLARRLLPASMRNKL